MEKDQADTPERTRLTRFDEPAAGWRYAPAWQPFDPRDYGNRRTRRASNWTAAALVAGVAVTTGYLAHNVPATGTSSSTGHAKTRHHTRRSAAVPGAPAVQAPAPAVQAPVVTSGGSGARGGGGGGD